MEQPRDIVVKVAHRDTLARGIVGLTLAAVDGMGLPDWTPGAHIDLKLPVSDADGMPLIRQYSLCGDPGGRDGYRVGILHEAAGRGGSAFVHETLKEGDLLTISAPRNHFPFEPGQKTLFITGGIGITPILPMVRQAAAQGRDWHLVAATRSRDHLAFADELAALDPARVRFHFDDQAGLLDLAGLLDPLDGQTTVYSCGPGGLLDALQARNEGAAWRLRIERFAAAAPADLSGDGFDVICASNGQRLHVPAGKSILEVLRAAGIKVESSCKDGICGTCETRVLRGIPDHRDSVLTEAERADGEYMMICVSRCKGRELELDI
ncbi:PDR/VanB family oxidoreductase [Paracoccus alkenifer]|uniref:Ferredoxin-NADP reductase n=1 Tax=Paracoccus alkenifer TaxID=65735 RepID=A0A1H6LWH6_9RHOB|nr:PDR/VanB family oxidoreductase [Paracoccus alkenifer]SEH89891.1 Ferredoxin-NADP reductase [Paracoccus alkenifer]